MYDLWDEDFGGTSDVSEYQTQESQNVQINEKNLVKFSERNYKNHAAENRQISYGKNKINQRRVQPYNEGTSESMFPTSFVGRVIGRGGSKIQELQKDCGANETPIRIFGSFQAETLIKYMISKRRHLSTSKNGNRRNQPASDTNPTVKNYAYQPGEVSLTDWNSLNNQSEEARRCKLAAVPSIKDFYQEVKNISMNRKETELFRSKNCISMIKVDPNDHRKILNPVHLFKHAFQHYPESLDEMKRQGLTKPSPIQCQAWPILMKGYNMIGIAQTGTDKMIAFFFPALTHLVAQVTPREKCTRSSILILAPTCELAQQIEAEAKKYTYQGIKSICIYSCSSPINQISIVTGVDIVIATPGQLNDLVMKIIDVTGVTYFVLDEADRMLDLGFECQIRKIVLDIRPDRQTVMISATWTNDIQELVARYMTKSFKVNIGPFDLNAVHTVNQEVIFASNDYAERRELLIKFIGSMGSDDKAIVFIEKKCIASDILSDLLVHGVKIQSIYGDTIQHDKEKALNDLERGYIQILIITDAASHGLDTKDISLIFNLYFPRNFEDYVHRVGCIGRTGKVISVFTKNDSIFASRLIKILEEANQFVPNELYDLAEKFSLWKNKKISDGRATGGRNRHDRNCSGISSGIICKFVYNCYLLMCNMYDTLCLSF